MSLTQDLPVFSPVNLPAILAGVRAMAGGGAMVCSVIEHLIRSEYGSDEILLTDSGTSALSLALTAVTRETGVSRGTVLAALPAYCCYDIATAADAAGVRVVLYDLDPATLGPDWDSLERALLAGATAVVVAHLYGIPADMPRLAELCRGRALLIEDAAQAAGASLLGRPAGSWGPLSVLSFGRGKGRTGGGGGALLANDSAGGRMMAGIRDSVRRGGPGGQRLIATLAQWSLARPAVYGALASAPFLGLGKTTYRPARPPAGISTSCAGVLGQTWALTAGEVRIRQGNAESLAARVGAESTLKIPRVPPGMVPGYLRFPVIVPDGARAAAAAFRSLGVMPGYPLPLSDLPGFGERCLPVGHDYPGARRLAQALFTLPVHSRVRPETLRHLERWVGETGRSTPARTTPPVLA